MKWRNISWRMKISVIMKEKAKASNRERNAISCNSNLANDYSLKAGWRNGHRLKVMTAIQCLVLMASVAMIGNR